MDYLIKAVVYCYHKLLDLMEEFLMMFCDMYYTADQTKLLLWPFWSQNLFQVHVLAVLSYLRVNYIFFIIKTLSLWPWHMWLPIICYESMLAEKMKELACCLELRHTDKRTKIRIVVLLVQIKNNFLGNVNFSEDIIICKRMNVTYTIWKETPNKEQLRFFFFFFDWSIVIWLFSFLTRLPWGVINIGKKLWEP